MSDLQTVIERACTAAKCERSVLVELTCDGKIKKMGTPKVRGPYSLRS